MKHYFILILFITACQGSLTSEQKHEVREGIKANEIKRISEAEILDAAFEYGRMIANKIKEQNVYPENVSALKNLEKIHQVVIFPLAPGDSLLMEIEKQLIEAYTFATNEQLSDNVQKLGSDSLLYTLPIMETQPDGSEVFKYAVGIRMPKKAVILSMEN